VKQEFQLFPRAASSIAPEVDALHLYLVAVSVVAATLIAVTLVVFGVRYRRRQGHVSDTSITGSTRLELLWTAVPLLFVLSFFGWGAQLFTKMVTVPDSGMQFHVTGKQWMWKVQHPTGQREINSLHVPAGEDVILTMISEDVIHDFYVPAFRIKADVLPGRYTRAWFHATRPGRYHLFCAEYCGTKHAEMIGEVVVLEPAEYQQWLRGAPAGQDPVVAGRMLFEQYRCDSCHEPGPGQRGPLLGGLAGSQRPLEDGRVALADDAYLRESILDPARQVVAGYQPLMPSYKGQVSEDEILQLIAYIKSLPAPAPADGDEPR
jgi:cytochrome c oxidase subunit 2